MEGKVRLYGTATHRALEGDRVEIEVDLGTTGHIYTALENEPPDVTLVRVTREQELVGEMSALRLELDRIKKRNSLLERELSAVTAEDSEFMRSLGKVVADELFSHLAARIAGRED